MMTNSLQSYEYQRGSHYYFFDGKKNQYNVLVLRVHRIFKAVEQFLTHLLFTKLCSGDEYIYRRRSTKSKNANLWGYTNVN